MLEQLMKMVFGDPNKKELKVCQGYVDKINALEPEISGLSDARLRAKTDEFRLRLTKGETLDDLLPEAFAVVREAAKRVMGLRHFDVQLMGGCILHRGKIAEMRTGEGKTLVATLPAYLNALEGKGVHVVTVNDYLARRDSEDMGRVYRFLGLSVGLITHEMDYPARKAAYAADITYGTNNEFGFDYLRDNMVISLDQMVQRPLHYAIVDEVDSILIDEARTPLIISGPGAQSTSLYQVMADVAAKLKEGEDYTVDEKQKTVAPTETGIAKTEKLLGVSNMYDGENGVDYSHQLMAALKAKALMHRDRDYVVKDGEVIIVDEFTGRLMFGRRYSEGLHQAIEAKEHVKVERESQTLATITFQNYFRMYDKLSGMTGTAKTEEQEFQKIYGLDVVVVPTNKPNIRIDYPDVIYKTRRAKYRAVANAIEELHKKGRPVLVGTTSIQQSEELSELLKKRGIEHNVLNAKFHEKEAEIVADAGQMGAVTIATNMAGRGTDIVLGDGVAELGGLHIIGTERHESRRIDNQLRGRCARQGDPGSTRFYLSLEDDLMRLFGSDNISGIMDKLGMEEDEPIEHKIVTRSIESAQKKVEARNFEIRKQVLEYDDVMNQQREVIYDQRRQILEKADLKETVLDMASHIVDRSMDMYAPKEAYSEDWDVKSLISYAEEFYAPAGFLKEEKLQEMSRDELETFLHKVAVDYYNAREENNTAPIMRELENLVMLKVVDSHWMEHLDAMDALREGIGLRAYGQRDPLVEYKFEAYEMFEAMKEAIVDDVVRYMYRVNVVTQPVVEDHLSEASTNNPNVDGSTETPKEPVRNDSTVGRNDPCPCGSGKKYKNCCGKNQNS
ncbi:SecA cross-linking domain protein [Acidaminococcus sp. BV3L6]|nr:MULTISPECIES: preprotein translocase subunit SecA [Acidaminococcus]EEH90973.1 preprotein translocase, SecA subunit [Acidaminococcus intestini]EPD73456.1 preprotein translocase, SecA subunit [Acidaminococcus sp. HPA0509]ERL20299.1 SecA cross-linking domain protein [Acidaminococcus sp. BV3L6]RJU38169.1 preprotein translocase subunit SecA [Acidaminococcus sp. AM33-14BH]CDB95492.1 protein translocase subunit SecA [Acidaminococcus intestini CAG:325]